MTKISCGVRGCMNNVDGGCSRREIEMSGFSAISSSDTSCCQYIPMEAGMNVTNKAPKASSSIVGCTAIDCRHNNAGSCKSSSVSLSRGIRGAECETFVLDM